MLVFKALKVSVIIYPFPLLLISAHTMAPLKLCKFAVAPVRARALRLEERCHKTIRIERAPGDKAPQLSDAEIGESPLRFEVDKVIHTVLSSRGNWRVFFRPCGVVKVSFDVYAGICSG